ncbi:uncharacterized protein LOC129230512 [Uloborus diversus]|uniref:uncharacterized protein LOC129230512 n=1 Tax=Uloborus diversus TaxID=327109 RepID=UPI002409E68A|nr:uncharacterized protein LOC129230512 [Uloborus diversus]
MMDDEPKRKFNEIDDDVPEEDQIFSSRIKRFPIITPEEVEKMMKESEEKDPEVIKEVEIEVEEIKPSRGRRGKRRGRGRGKTNAKIKIKKTSEEVLLQAAEEEDLNLSKTTKRRLQRLQEDEAYKRQQIEEENARVLSFDLSDDDLNVEVIDLDCSTPQKNSELSLKVHYLADIKKIKCQQSEKFSSIFCKVADAFNLKASEVLLCHKDRNIQVDDTPSREK